MAKKSLELALGLNVKYFNCFLKNCWLVQQEERKRSPTIGHDMGREKWNAIGKMVVYLIKRDVHYFPLNFSLAFMSSCLFGEEQMTPEDQK